MESHSISILFKEITRLAFSRALALLPGDPIECDSSHTLTWLLHYYGCCCCCCYWFESLPRKTNMSFLTKWAHVLASQCAFHGFSFQKAIDCPLDCFHGCTSKTLNTPTFCFSRVHQQMRWPFIQSRPYYHLSVPSVDLSNVPQLHTWATTPKLSMSTRSKRCVDL